MDYLFQDGGKPKAKKSKTGSKTTKSKTGTKTKTATKSKTGTKTGSKTTKSKTPKKGGNFLGAVGDLVAPTGWGSFATAAALVGIDQADAAFRRRKSEKSSAKKGGMRGGYFSVDYLKEIERNIIEKIKTNKKAADIIISQYNRFFSSFMSYLRTNDNDKYINDKKKYLSSMIEALEVITTNPYTSSDIFKDIKPKIDEILGTLKEHQKTF
jgi:hypothetical protein